MSLPTSIGGGTLAVWFDGSDNSTIALSGSNVMGWADKSGNGRNASYFGSTPPTKTNLGIRFNSSRMALSVPFGSNLTVFMVASPSSTSESYFFGTDLGGSGPTFIQNYIGNSLEYFNGTDRFTIAPNLAQTYIATFSHNNTTMNGYYQGNNVYTSNARSNVNSGIITTLGAAQLGGAGTINAIIYEFIVYNSYLSDADRKAVDNYLQRKYAKLLGLSFDRSVMRGKFSHLKGSNCFIK